MWPPSLKALKESTASSFSSWAKLLNWIAQWGLVLICRIIQVNGQYFPCWKIFPICSMLEATNSYMSFGSEWDHELLRLNIINICVCVFACLCVCSAKSPLIFCHPNEVENSCLSSCYCEFQVLHRPTPSSFPIPQVLSVFANKNGDLSATLFHNS